MSFPRMIYRMIIIGVVLGLAGRVAAALPERKTFQFGEFTIEASVGDEVYVEALAVQLAEYKLPELAPRAPAQLSLDVLAKRRENFLKQIAAYLGLDQPTEQMGQAYDRSLQEWRVMDVMPALLVPRHFKFWRKSEVLARLDKGQEADGIISDRYGDLAFLLGPDATADPKNLLKPQPSAQQHAQAWSNRVWPVIIGSSDQSPQVVAATSLDKMSKSAAAVIGKSSLVAQTEAFIAVLRTTTEAGVTSGFLKSKDRQWFCGGVAFYVSMKIAKSVDAGEADGYEHFNYESVLVGSDSIIPRIDLASWPAAEDLEGLKYPADLNTVNYAFATKVIADVCAKYGDGFLPKLFNELAKMPREKATIDTVYKAFKRLTREDLRSYLPKPTSKR